ncbi:MAG: class I SAM-dependent methyltransferase [Thermomicrobiales bacterium]
MDEELRRVLDGLLAAGREHDEREAVHARRLLNLEADTAQLMAILIQSGRRTRVLEIGTSNGYSAIWLAWALRPLGGHLTSIERDGAKQAEADANLRRVGLREVVTLREGDATAVVAELAGPFDCVFFDADRRSAPEQLRLLLPKLTDDALLLCDNVLSHPAEVADYLAAVEALPDFQHVVVPIGKGLSVAHRLSRKS